ncbi:MAG: hypothetical protein JSW05_04130 [Candidatus Thorarchaeota archaeon]|nr:MAG: hypothetical protein JSW05_04130 [Candidatus Thorarchaeota archaeon]
MKDSEFTIAWSSALLMGTLYLVGGLLWLAASLGLPIPVPSVADPMSAFVLVIVAVIFFSGVRPLRKGDRNGFGFIAVGVLLAGIMFGLQLVILSTNYLGWVLGLEDWVSWDAVSNLTPTVWLFLFVLFLFAIARAVEGDGEGGFTKHLLGG